LLRTIQDSDNRFIEDVNFASLVKPNFLVLFGIGQRKKRLLCMARCKGMTGRFAGILEGHLIILLFRLYGYVLTTRVFPETARHQHPQPKAATCLSTFGPSPDCR